jgi:adenylosuccinate synthase
VVALRTASELNGTTGIAITKLDVLDDEETVRIAVAYEINGERYERMPENLDLLGSVTPVYEDLPGWRRPLRDAKSLEDLPSEARRYIDRMAELADCEIWCVSVGPARDETIIL